MVELSVIICTHNRSFLLNNCLNALVNQKNDNTEILVIDNGSIDNTKLIVQDYLNQYPQISYIYENNIGLSHARNRGIKESKSEWILYIDDDSIAFPNLISRAIYLAGIGDFDCVGGMYYGYYEQEKPNWIDDKFGTKYLYAKNLTVCPYDIPSGGIVLYRKAMLIKLKGFSTILGMAGEIKSLGEETELQYRASKFGYKIGFDPELKIHHLVKPEYTKLSWFLKRAFLQGNASAYMSPEENTLITFIKLMKSIAGLILRRFPYNFYCLVIKKNFYWQNMVYVCLKPIMLISGKLIGKLKKTK